MKLYTYVQPLKKNTVGLKGNWIAQKQCITAKGDDSYLECNFLAKQVYLVVSGSGPVPMEVFLDGQPVKKIHVDGDRKYDIISTDYGWHLLSLKVPEGISAYAFTFGDE